MQEVAKERIKSFDQDTIQCSPPSLKLTVSSESIRLQSLNQTSALYQRVLSWLDERKIFKSDPIDIEDNYHNKNKFQLSKTAPALLKLNQNSLLTSRLNKKGLTVLI